MDKSADYSINDVEGSYVDEGTVLGEKTGTVGDKEAMARLGKEQVFKVSTFPLSLTPAADRCRRETSASSQCLDSP